MSLSLQDIASLGSPDWSNPSVAYSLGTQDGQFGPGFSSRGVVKGSPVVPGSSQKVLEEGDQVLYTVTVLRGQYQASLKSDYFGRRAVDTRMPLLGWIRERDASWRITSFFGTLPSVLCVLVFVRRF